MAITSQPEWIPAELHPTAADAFACELGCPVPIATLLISRGIVDFQQARAFFNPDLTQLTDPFEMLGMHAAVCRIRSAVEDDQSILIYGDYDVDGTLATVLLKTAIERIAPAARPARVSYHVPHRIREGYGMQDSILERAATEGVQLVISVDTGIRAFSAALQAKTLGMDLIVTDHHLPDGVAGSPDAFAVINPAQEGCAYPFKGLCGAAVAFKLAHALLLSDAGDASEAEHLNRRLIPSLLKLVAIATIADCVPLTGENRVIAALGLAGLKRPVQPGLRALMQISKLSPDRSPTSTEVAFRLAPRINAAGRMDVASDVVELFLTRDSTLAMDLAEKLDRLNHERRATETRALALIEEQLAQLANDKGEYPAECLVLDNPDWHRGVIGILASRVVDRTARPALVITHEEGQAHGSGRSIDGFHLLDALTAVNLDPEDISRGKCLFTRYGGHAYAAGFSLPSIGVPLLRERLRTYAATVLTPRSLVRRVKYDVAVPLDQVDENLRGWLLRCGPFGAAHAEPVLASFAVSLAAPLRVIQDKHVALQLCVPTSTARWHGVAWSRQTSWVEHCRTLGLERGSVIDVLYRLKLDSNPAYPRLELELLDIRKSEGQAVAPSSLSQTSVSPSGRESISSL